MRQTRGRAALAAFGAVTVWLALVQAITLGTSTLGLTLARGGAVAGLVASAAIAIAFGLWLTRAGAANSSTPAGARPRADAPATAGTPAPPAPVAAAGAEVAGHVPGDRFERGIVALALAWAASVWVRLWVLAANRPPYDWDGLYYHIPALHGWTLRGRVAWIGDAPDVPFVNLPMGVEAHTFFMHRILGGTNLVSMCNLWYWPLGFLALVVIAGRLGARGPWPWLAGALLAGVPVVVCQSATSYTDPAFAFTVMGALAAASVFAFDQGLPPLPRTLLFGASLGLIAGAKGTGAPFALILFVAACACAIAVHGARAWRAWAWRIAVVAILAAAVGGHWYVRNAVRTGNPIHPIQLVFGAKLLKPGYDHVAFSEANLPAWLERVPAAVRTPVSWLQLDAPVGGYAPVGGLGYAWLVAALPAAVIVLWRSVRRVRRRARRGAAPAPVGASEWHEPLFLAGLLILMLSVQTATWWSRFTMWLHALGLPALAVLLQEWNARATRGGALPLAGAARFRVRGLLPLAALVAVLALAAWESERTLAIEWNTGRIAGASAGQPAYRTSLARLFPGLSGDPTFERFSAETRIARSQWGSYGTLLGGILAMPLGRRTIEVLPDEPTERDIDGLRARGISWVVWDERGAGPVPRALADRAVEHKGWRPWPEEWFHVLRLGDRVHSTPPSDARQPESSDFGVRRGREVGVARHGRVKTKHSRGPCAEIS